MERGSTANGTPDQPIMKSKVNKGQPRDQSFQCAIYFSHNNERNNQGLSAILENLTGKIKENTKQIRRGKNKIRKQLRKNKSL